MTSACTRIRTISWDLQFFFQFLHFSPKQLHSLCGNLVPLSLHQSLKGIRRTWVPQTLKNYSHSPPARNATVRLVATKLHEIDVTDEGNQIEQVCRSGRWCRPLRMLCKGVTGSLAEKLYTAVKNRDEANWPARIWTCGRVAEITQSDSHLKNLWMLSWWIKQLSVFLSTMEFVTLINCQLFG